MYGQMLGLRLCCWTPL